MASDPAPPVSVIVNTRAFAAPRDRVFAAFADPAQLARWWGPSGFTNTFNEFDFRPGGFWRFVMRGPDVATYDLVKEFVEVTPLQRIVLQQHGPSHRFRHEMDYAASPAGGTVVTWRLTFEVPEPAAVGQYITQANEENFDRLAALLRAS